MNVGHEADTGEGQRDVAAGGGGFRLTIWAAAFLILVGGVRLMAAVSGSDQPIMSLLYIAAYLALAAVAGFLGYWLSRQSVLAGNVVLAAVFLAAPAVLDLGDERAKAERLVMLQQQLQAIRTKYAGAELGVEQVDRRMAEMAAAMAAAGRDIGGGHGRALVGAARGIEAYRADVAPLAKRMSVLQDGGGLRPRELTSLEAVRAARTTGDDALAAAQEYREVVRGFPDALDAAIQAEQGDHRARAEIVAALSQATARELIRTGPVVRQLTREREMLALLEEAWGRWEYDGATAAYLFEDAALQAQFDALVTERE